MEDMATHQSDPQELFTFLFERMSPSFADIFSFSDVKRIKLADNSVSDLTTNIDHCKIVHTVGGRLNHLSIPFPGDLDANDCKLIDLLNGYTSVEAIDPVAGTQQKTQNPVISGPLPSVLVVQLMRTAFNTTTQKTYRRKNNVTVDPMIGLKPRSFQGFHLAKKQKEQNQERLCDQPDDLSDEPQFTVLDPSNPGIGQSVTAYRLVGMICHSGSSANSGHYFSATRNPVNGSWWMNNDETITQLIPPNDPQEAEKLDNILTKAKVRSMVYMTFYERVDLHI
jgi:uncharacterized UBP type Zn finger protein